MPDVALIHDWLIAYGGAERITAALSEIWPQAPIYTLAHDPHGECRVFTEGRTVHTSLIQRLPFARTKYRSYLPLMPYAIEQFDLAGHELVISTSHAVAHGVLTGPEQLHINYICIPVRYAWHQYHRYLKDGNLLRGPKSWFARAVLHYLRLWDLAAATRVDHFVAISSWVAQNVWRVYRRPAQVIYPPVDVDAFTPVERKEDFYLTVSRLVPYKKIDLIVQAFASMPDKKLVVVGDGPDEARIRAQATPNIEILGYQPAPAVRDLMQRARAFLFAAEEDFGIVPIEAQACGTPVIAYGRGGSLETVVAGKTGVFFYEQTPQAIGAAVNELNNAAPFRMADLRANAERFNSERFKREMTTFVHKNWEKFHQSRPPTQV